MDRPFDLIYIGFGILGNKVFLLLHFFNVDRLRVDMSSFFVNCWLGMLCFLHKIFNSWGFDVLLVVIVCPDWTSSWLLSLNTQIVTLSFPGRTDLTSWQSCCPWDNLLRSIDLLSWLISHLDYLNYYLLRELILFLELPLSSRGRLSGCVM